jgi:hypothetical protein
VGDYFPSGRTGRWPLGADSDGYFETMVFRLGSALNADNDGCVCREVSEWTELECVRYATAGEADDGHARMVDKYEGLP